MKNIKYFLFCILLKAILIGSPAIANYESIEFNSAIKIQSIDEQVLICLSPNAYAFHKNFCRGLSNCNYEVKKVALNKAQMEGYKACKICYK